MPGDHLGDAVASLEMEPLDVLKPVESGGLLGLLHLLHDDREIAGVGESEFTRGACWVAPLDIGAPLT